MPEEEEEGDEIVAEITLNIYKLSIVVDNLDSDELELDISSIFSINVTSNSEIYDPILTKEIQSYTVPVRVPSETKEISIYETCCILFDPGANCNMVNSAELFERLSPCIKNISVKGVGNAKLQCEGMGTLIGPFAGVQAMYVPELKTSIISEDAIEKWCDIERTKGENGMKSYYTIINKESGVSLRCVKSIENLYCGDLRKLAGKKMQKEYNTLPN